MGADSRGPSSTDPSSTTSSSGVARGDERASSTLLNALIGGVVGVLLSFIPFATVLGGGVAGYLEGGDRMDGARVGAIAGLIVFVPLLFVGLAVLVFIPVTPTAGAGFGVQLALWVSLLVIVLLAALYTIGLSALGGVLGVYAKNEL